MRSIARLCDSEPQVIQFPRVRSRRSKDDGLLKFERVPASSSSESRGGPRDIFIPLGNVSSHVCQPIIGLVPWTCTSYRADIAGRSVPDDRYGVVGNVMGVIVDVTNAI